MDLNNIYRYSIKNGDFGGIVLAGSLDVAKTKVLNKYYEHNAEDVLVWLAKLDDYFDSENPDVIECY